ncbi:MAG: LPS assembly lipoprotein LptE [Pseudomonadota bacterium]
MQRRHLLTLTAAGAALSVTGCGFELRKAPNFPFKSIYIPYSEGNALGIELRRSLESGGNVRVVTDSRFIDQTDVILDVVSETREKVVLSRNAAGLVREFQLRLRFVFRLRTPKGKELIPSAEILQQRDISFNESAALAKESEEALLYREMQSDVVQQIMRRLAAVTEL